MSSEFSGGHDVMKSSYCAGGGERMAWSGMDAQAHLPIYFFDILSPDKRRLLFGLDLLMTNDT